MTKAELIGLRRDFWADTVLSPRGRFRSCWFAQFDSEPCSGPIQACHFIKRRRVENYLFDIGLDADLIALGAWDPRNAVPGCEGHHTRFDGHRMPPLVIWRHQVPASVEAFALDWGGLAWSLERDHPVIYSEEAV